MNELNSDNVQKALTEWSKRNAEKGRDHMAERNAVKGEDMVFVVEPYEQLTLTNWVAEHKETCKYRHISLTYKFTNTGIGVATIVECRCGEEVNITDYDMW